MGAYVSVEGCKAHYNATVDCSSNLTDKIPTVGGHGLTEVPPDTDIAGIGIVSVFIGVTSFALALSIIHVLWTFTKFIGWKHQYSSEEKKLHRRCGNISVSKVCEALVMSCSDQQLFTGGAYAIALRYWKGCKIIAYHYNIVSNMMLLTCATHLMSVTITENYFEYPELGIVRTVVVTGAFLVAGILLTNQNADAGLQFPTRIPLSGDPNSRYMFLPAACFQKGSPSADTVKTSFSSSGSRDAFLFSDVGNHIQGWNWYLIILLFYGAAVIVGLFRFFHRGFKKAGRRARILRRTGNMVSFNPENQHSKTRALFKTIYLLYLSGGIGISAATVVISGRYIMSLRGWAKESHWLEDKGGGQSEEDDATSFGQLVPIFLCLLTLFSFVQTISQMREKHDQTGEIKPNSVIYEPVPSNLALSPKKATFDNVEIKPIPTPSDLDSHFQFNVGQGSPPMVSPTHMSMPESYIATPVSNGNGQGNNYFPVMPIMAPSPPQPQQGWQGSPPA